MSITSTRRSDTATVPQTNARAERSELAVSAESDNWKDRPHYKERPRLRSVLLLLGILALCALVAVTQIQRRWKDRDTLQVTQAVLTADPIILESAGNGRVIDVNVGKGDKVTAGQSIAVVEYDAKPGETEGAKRVEITAPADGVVTAVFVVPGVGVLGGTDLLDMYEPSKLYFEAPMSYSNISSIEVGAKATFDVPGLGDVDALAARVEADYGEAGDEGTERLGRVVYIPVDPAATVAAVPGVIVDGKAHKNADDPNAPKVLSGS